MKGFLLGFIEAPGTSTACLGDGTRESRKDGTRDSHEDGTRDSHKDGMRESHKGSKENSTP